MLHTRLLVLLPLAVGAVLALLFLLVVDTLLLMPWENAVVLPPRLLSTPSRCYALVSEVFCRLTGNCCDAFVDVS